MEAGEYGGSGRYRWGRGEGPRGGPMRSVSIADLSLKSVVMVRISSANSSAFSVFAHQREIAEACQGVCSTKLLSTIF